MPDRLVAGLVSCTKGLVPPVKFQFVPYIISFLKITKIYIPSLHGEASNHSGQNDLYCCFSVKEINFMFDVIFRV